MMFRLFFKDHKELLKTVTVRYKIIFAYLFIVIFLGFTESFGIALLFPISELIQNQEIVNQYTKIFFEYSGYNISSENLISIIFISAFLLFLISGVTQIISFNIAARLTDGLYSVWQQKIFKYYLNAKYSFLVNNMSGDLIQRLILHSESAVQVVLHVCMITKELILISFIIIILSSLSLKLTMYLILLGVLFTILSSIFGKLNIFKVANKVALHQKNAVSIATEAINSIKLIKSYSLEKTVSNRFSDEVTKRAKYLIYNQSFINAPGVVFRTITLLIMLSALLFITKSNYENTGQIISFFILFAGAGYRINGSIGTMNNSLLSMANVIPSLQIISRELSKHLINDESNENLKDDEIRYNSLIEFKKVFFSYEEEGPTILNDINLKIKKGSLLGIVGKSGSGKSTLIDLILKLYLPNTGNIFVDENDLKLINKKKWRKTLGYVGQNTQILSGNIYSNITFNYDDSISIDEDLKEAVRIANIDNYIMSLPDNFKTEISENGENISAGQKQRIAISRAIYLNPNILLFDEATSNLNPSSEEKIFSNLKSFCKKNNTTLVHVTHRTDLLKELDEIIFIDQGKIIVQGKHEKLLAESSEYLKFISNEEEKIL